jgi:hypothetical protein
LWAVEAAGVVCRFGGLEGRGEGRWRVESGPLGDLFLRRRAGERMCGGWG